MRRARRSLAVVVLALASGCGKPPIGYRQVMPVPHSAVPPPGQCRIYSGRLVDQQSHECTDLEWVANPGQMILYRPVDTTGNVVVCYMDRTEPGVIYAVDVFDIGSRQLVEVIQHPGQPPPTGGCHMAVWEWLRR